jgi:MYXO-CTERM domain-containing protein
LLNSIAFDTDTNPVPIDNTPTSFTVPFAGFIYTLNGVNLGLTPSEIIFYKASEGGGFVVDMTVSDQFSFTAPQMYTGSTFAPTMLYGTFVSVSDPLDYLMVDGNFVGSLAGTTLNATPEPGTVALAAAGILGLFAAHRRRSRLADRN